MADQTPRHIVAASALVKRADGGLLLVRTPRRGWELPGGQIELGETVIDGLKREVHEESGVEIEVGRLASVRSNLSGNIIIFGFEADYLSGQLRPSDETPDLRWVSAADALDMVTHPAVAQCLRDILAARPEVIYRAYIRRPYRETQRHMDH